MLSLCISIRSRTIADLLWVDYQGRCWEARLLCQHLPTRWESGSGCKVSSASNHLCIRRSNKKATACTFAAKIKIKKKCELLHLVILLFSNICWKPRALHWARNIPHLPGTYSVNGREDEQKGLDPRAETAALLLFSTKTVRLWVKKYVHSTYILYFKDFYISPYLCL